MDTLEKAELTASISHIARFFKSGIPIYNSKDSETASRKTRGRRRTRRKGSLGIAMRYAFYTNAVGNTTIKLTVKSRKFYNPW